MAETVSLPGLATALILPWFLGGVWVLWLLRPTGRWNAFLVAGQGYLVGVLLTTVVMRLWQFIGLPLHFWGMAATLAGLTLAGLLALRLQAANDRNTAPAAPLQKWQLAVTALFLLLIATRYATVAWEMSLRPLFPWDAWMNWAPKAMVWFHFRDIVPYVSAQDWLNATPDAMVYTAGATRAWEYPDLVPLLELWGMLGAGVSDHTLIYLPWLFASAALGLGLYGHLRLRGVTVPVATLACYALLNMPLFSAYAALPGYADLWLAASFGCAVFALQEWSASRHGPYAVLALLLAIVCTQIKIPGLIMGGIVLFVYLTSLVHPGRRLVLALLALGALSAVYILAVGVDFTLPHIGRVVLSDTAIDLPYIGHYALSYHPVHEAFATSTLLMVNWNLLWYVFFLVVVLRVVRGTLLEPPSLVLRAIMLALMFIAFVYYFTNRYAFAEDFTQVNRALMYTVPPLVFYLVLACFASPQGGLKPRLRNSSPG